MNHLGLARSFISQPSLLSFLSKGHHIHSTLAKSSKLTLLTLLPFPFCQTTAFDDACIALCLWQSTWALESHTQAVLSTYMGTKCKSSKMLGDPSTFLLQTHSVTLKYYFTFKFLHLWQPHHATPILWWLCLPTEKWNPSHSTSPLSD